MRRFIAVVILYCVLVSQSFAAQNDVQKSNKYNVNIASEYIFESYANQELIPIRLLGSVKNAGLYHIPADMKLSTLLALAGGTSGDADLGKIIIGNDQQKVKNYKGEETKSLQIDLEDTLKKGAYEDYTLVANDIVLIQNKSPIVSNDAFRTISIVSVILTSILTAIVIKDRYKK
jgi:hypothetical protein